MTKSEHHDKSIAHQLGLTARILRNYSAERLKGLNLFPGQEQVLEALLSHDNALSMGDLAQELHVKAPTISKTILRLTAQGLVKRIDCNDDKRQVLVCLTQAGRECALKLKSISNGIEDVLSQGFDAKERKRFRKYLRKITRNLQGVSHPHDEDDHDD